MTSGFDMELKRRSFLGILLGAAAAPVLSNVLPPLSNLGAIWTPADPAPTIGPTILPGETTAITGLRAYSMHATPQARLFRLMRQSGVMIFESALGPTSSGVWRFSDSPHSWVISPPTDPVLFDVDPNIELHVYYQGFSGSSVRPFVRKIRGTSSIDTPLGREDV